MYLPTRNYFLRLALTTFAAQQRILKGMAVPPTDLVAWTLRGANRVAIKVADMTLLRAAAAIGPTSLLEWLTLWVVERTVVVFRHLNRRANTERGGRMTSSANATWPVFSGGLP
jgi:hypothetical protein